MGAAGVIAARTGGYLELDMGLSGCDWGEIRRGFQRDGMVGLVAFVDV